MKRNRYVSALEQVISAEKIISKQKEFDLFCFNTKCEFIDCLDMRKENLKSYFTNNPESILQGGIFD